MPRLTQRLVARVVAEAGREVILWDDLVVGFGLRVRGTGRRTWIVRYRRSGLERKYTIAPAALLGVEAARDRARKVLLLVADGRDPAEERRAARDGMTIAELAGLFLAERVDQPGHVTYKNVTETHLLPLLGRLTVAAVVELDVVEALRKIKAGPGKDATSAEGRRRHKLRRAGGKSIAKLCLATLSAMFAMPEARHLRAGRPSPVANIKPDKSAPRRQALTVEQYARIGAVLARLAHERLAPPGALDALWLLALTGFRCGEIQGTPLDACDADAQTIDLARTKTGPRTAVLGAAAAAIIRRRLQEAGEGERWLIAPLPGRAKPVGIAYAWAKVRTAAGLPRLRIHDLRHSFITLAVEIGVALPIVQALVGHSTGSSARAAGVGGVTGEYVHLRRNVVRDESDRIAAAIHAAMTQGLPALAVPPALIEHNPNSDREGIPR